MKAWRCLVVLSFLLLGGCLVTFKESIPPREAAPSHLLGTWSRENEWKEEQFLEITRSGSNVYRALSYVDSKDNTESLEDYGFTVSHQGKRWYLSAGLPKSLGGNFIIAGFEITDGDELVIYNLDVERIVEDLGAGQLDGETVDSDQGKGALVRSPLAKVFAYLNDPANSDVFVEAARFQRVTQ